MSCNVNWGSHGCAKPSGHNGPHECDCCDCENHERDHKANGCVAGPPYFGPATLFWGSDVPEELHDVPVGEWPQHQL